MAAVPSLLVASHPRHTTRTSQVAMVPAPPIHTMATSHATMVPVPPIPMASPSLLGATVASRPTPTSRTSQVAMVPVLPNPTASPSLLATVASRPPPTNRASQVATVPAPPIPMRGVPNPLAMVLVPLIHTAAPRPQAVTAQTSHATMVPARPVPMAPAIAMGLAAVARTPRVNKITLTRTPVTSIEGWISSRRGLVERHRLG
jgi:hypothetical protein